MGKAMDYEEDGFRIADFLPEFGVAVAEDFNDFRLKGFDGLPERRKLAR